MKKDETMNEMIELADGALVPVTRDANGKMRLVNRRLRINDPSLPLDRTAREIELHKRANARWRAKKRAEGVGISRRQKMIEALDACREYLMRTGKPNDPANNKILAMIDKALGE